MGSPPDEVLAKPTAHFEHHQDTMRYPTYRAQGLFYGTGVIEGGCKSVIGQRLKAPGLFGTEPGARSVLTLPVALKSDRWNDCWDRLHDSHRLQLRLAA